MRFQLAVMAVLFLTHCASPVAAPAIAQRVGALLPTQALLLGEQHDAPSHPQAHLEAVQALAQRDALAALVLEMAEQGRSTTNLSLDASEAAVRESLGWNNKAWPWAHYRAAVMAAVRHGAPVYGGNLPRASLRAAMADTALDTRLDATALTAQNEAIRLGHCNALPESQIAPMTRVQVARDVAMANALLAAAQPEKTVVLMAGSGHVDSRLGVPRHMPANFKVATLIWPAQDTGKDYCAAFKR